MDVWTNNYQYDSLLPAYSQLRLEVISAVPIITVITAPGGPVSRRVYEELVTSDLVSTPPG